MDTSQQLFETVKKAFFNSTMVTFDKMAMVSLEAKKVDDIDAKLFALSGVIGFSGGILGNCALRLTSEMAKEVISRLAGEPIDNPTEISDGVGEFVNMIAGNAKASLSEYNIMLSFPEVIRGIGHEIGFHRHTDQVNLGFTCEIGDVLVIVAYSDPSKIISK